MGIVYKNGRCEVCLPFGFSHTVEKIYQYVTDMENIPTNDFYLTFDGKCLQSDNIVISPCIVRFHLRLPGGKGGFGSMLRAIGARIEKTTNHEACRDLSGRRMRDVNHEKQIGEWVAKTDDEEEERKQKRIAKLQNILNPKHNYQDKDYTSNLQNNAERIDEALKCALQKRDEKCKSKRKMEDAQTVGKQKKKRMWIGVNDESDDSENDCENIISASEDEPGCSKSMMGNPDTNDNNTHEDNGHDECEDSRLIEPDMAVDVCATNSVGSCEQNASCTTNVTDTVSNAENNDETCATIIASVSSTEIDSTSFMEDITNINKVAEIGGENTESCAVDITNINKVAEIGGENTECCAVDITNINEVAEIGGENTECPMDHAAEVVDSTPKEEPIDLNDFDSPEHLETTGLNRLKTALMAIGLKCGGTLQERAQRLFLTKNTPIDKLDRTLFAKHSKGKNKKKK